MLVVPRKGGIYEERFFVPPCKSVQLRGTWLSEKTKKDEEGEGERFIDKS